MEGDVCDLVVVDGDAGALLDDAGQADGDVVDQRAGGLDLLGQRVPAEIIVFGALEQVPYVQCKADQELRLRQIDIVKGIDVGDQLFNQGEAFRGDKILQIGDRDALVVDGRGTGDEEQGQLVDLGLVVFDPEILLR